MFNLNTKYSVVEATANALFVKVVKVVKAGKQKGIDIILVYEKHEEKG